jgi:hypothetical protein
VAVALNRDEQKYYENMFDMFQTEGWKQYVKQYKDIEASLVDGITHNRLSEQDYQFYLGDLSRTRTILAFEETVNTVYDNLTAEEPDGA